MAIPLKPNPDLAAVVPECVARENRVVPLAKWHHTLIVASDAPLPDEVRDKLRFVLGFSVRGVVRGSDWVNAALDELYRYDAEAAPTHIENTSWYWPGRHGYASDGTLTIAASGWNGHVHWSGCVEFLPNHPDYQFWGWVVDVRQFHRLVDEKEVPSLKRLWKRFLARRRESNSGG